MVAGPTRGAKVRRGAVVTELTAVELAAIEATLRDAGTRVAGSLHAEVIAGGRSNATFKITDGLTAWVLRMPPRAGRTPSAHDVGREFRVTKALERTGVPVPPAVVLCDNDTLLGAPFAIFEFVEGRTIQSSADLDVVPDALIECTVTRIVEVLAALHQVDHIAVGLQDFGRADGYASRQLRRWSGQWPLVTRGAADLDSLAERLRNRIAERIPKQAAVGIVHGDYRIDNTLLRVGDAGVQVEAVIDWELSTIGDPVADVAMMCIYRHPAFDFILGDSHAWTSQRLPPAHELAEAYERAGGVALTEWEPHMALAYYKLAVIAEGIDFRYREGVGSGPGFESAGAAVPELLTAGLRMLTAD